MGSSARPNLIISLRTRYARLTMFEGPWQYWQLHVTTFWHLRLLFSCAELNRAMWNMQASDVLRPSFSFSWDGQPPVRLQFSYENVCLSNNIIFTNVNAAENIKYLPTGRNLSVEICRNCEALNTFSLQSSSVGDESAVNSSRPALVSCLLQSLVYISNLTTTTTLNN